MNLIIINGPNLNLLGTREKEIYGDTSFDTYFEKLKAKHSTYRLTYFQSNHEGALIDKLHEVGFTFDGIVLNPGGFTHTSVALADAIAAIKAPVVEVHLSNIQAREAYRHHSYTGAKAVGIISGLGLRGYDLALQFLTNQ